MVRLHGSVWTVLMIFGMILLAAGAFSVIFILNPDVTMSAVYMVAGIALILVSSAFIHLDGSKLRKKDEDFWRFDEIRTEARKVPNNLKEGYMIDYNAPEPGKAVSFSTKGTEKSAENSDEKPDEDVLVIYFN
jgi:hypothetical protein